MSTNAAETETASTTETTETAAPVIPGRDEVLSHFAAEILGKPETATRPADAEPKNVDDALSQTGTEAGEGETAEELAAREAAEAEGAENHLEEDLRQHLPEEVQQRVNQRIGKEVARTKVEREAREAAEARATEAEAKLAERPQSTVHSPLAGPLGAIHDPAKLESEKLKAEQGLELAEDLLDQLRTNPAGVEATLREAKVQLKGEDGAEDFSEARMENFLRALKRNSGKMIRSEIPARAKFLAQADQAATQAVEFMPELKDAKSPQAKLFRQALTDLPELQNHPQWPLMAVLGVLGRQRLDEMIAAKAKVAPKKREVPVTIPAPRAQPPAAPRGKAAPVDANAIADSLLNGKKGTRMDYIKTLLPKG